MAKRQPVEPKDGPYSQQNRELLNRLYKMLLHPSFWDDRGTLTFSPRSLNPGVIITCENKFAHVIPKLQKFFRAQGFEAVANAHTLVVSEL